MGTPVHLGAIGYQLGIGRECATDVSFVGCLQHYKERTMTQTILITGTSSGLGRASAKLFQANGWNVIASMRAPERETELGTLDRVLVTRLDVQDPASIRSALEQGIARFGRIDALVNNAGYGAYGPLEATPPAAIRRQFDVNVLGLLDTIQAVLPHFRGHRSGTIVNVSSMGGCIAFPLGTLYHGTKFAVEGLSEALRYELIPLGIQVKLVEPGGIRTDFAGRSFDFNNDAALAEYQPTVEGVLGILGPMMADGGSAAEEIADVVFRAVTDCTDRLRYEAGPDAVRMLGKRRESDDASHFGRMERIFGIRAPEAV